MAGTSGTTTAFRSPVEGDERPRPLPLGRLVKGLCRWALAVIFLMAGVTKVTDLHGFAEFIGIHAGLPSSAGLVVAAVLPWLELTCGACLLLGYAVREAALLLVILLSGLFIYSLFHLNEPDCGCFIFPRPQELTLWWWPPLRNALLLVCAVRTAWR